MVKILAVCYNKIKSEVFKMKQFTEEELRLIGDKVFDQIKAESTDGNDIKMSVVDITLHTIEKFILELQKEN